MGNNTYETMQGIQSGWAQPIISRPLATRNQFSNDIEVIDLDSERRDVKPTTWHQN